jgi:hypothetical protein
MVLESTQPLVKMSTRDVPGSKDGRCVRLTTYHHIVPMSRNLGALTLLDPCGPAWPVMGVLYLFIRVCCLYKYLLCMERGSRRYRHYATRLEGLGFQSRQRQKLILYSATSGPTLGPTQPSTERIVEFLLEGKADRA